MIFSFKPVFTGQNDLLLLLLSTDISIEMKFLTLELKKYVFKKVPRRSEKRFVNDRIK